MAGFAAFDIADPEAGAAAGQAAGNRLMFHLTIVIDDVDHFIDDPMERGRAHGWVGCDMLGGRLPVERGDFNLFVDVGSGHKQMRYHLRFRDAAGHPLTLVGRKEVIGGPLTKVWAETTTLYTTIVRGHPAEGEEAPVVAAGVLHISPAAFARQVTTFRVAGGEWQGRPAAMARFARLFVGQLWEVFLGHKGKVEAH
jgi:cholesterol oxidase